MDEMMMERQERLEEALKNAHGGNGTDEDWAVICYECGVSALFNQQGNKNVNSESRSVNKQFYPSTGRDAPCPLLSNY
jgi:hypothetical protein